MLFVFVFLLLFFFFFIIFFFLLLLLLLLSLSLFSLLSWPVYYHQLPVRLSLLSAALSVFLARAQLHVHCLLPRGPQRGSTRATCDSPSPQWRRARPAHGHVAERRASSACCVPPSADRYIDTCIDPFEWLLKSV